MNGMYEQPVTPTAASIAATTQKRARAMNRSAVNTICFFLSLPVTNKGVLAALFQITSLKKSFPPPC